MKALPEFGKSPVYMDLPNPIVGPDEVRAAVKAGTMSQKVKSRRCSPDDVRILVDAGPERPTGSADHWLAACS